MKLIIAGSRSITDYRYVSTLIDDFIDKEKINVKEIVTGDARGVDAIARQYADKCGYKLRVFKADWQKFGRRAGPLRNKAMANYGDLLLAIWDGYSSGTANMIERMIYVNKPYFVSFCMKYNIWQQLGKVDAICITTNGFLAKGNRAVLGRGIALQARLLFPNLDYALGNLLRQHGNHVFRLLEYQGTFILSFPVKPEYVVVDCTKSNVITQDVRPGDVVPGFLAKADPGLITNSANELADMIEKFNYKKVLLPKPGCGNGGLSWDIVFQALLNSRLTAFANRVYICTSDKAICFASFLRPFSNINTEQIYGSRLGLA